MAVARLAMAVAQPAMDHDAQLLAGRLARDAQQFGVIVDLRRRRDGVVESGGIEDPSVVDGRRSQPDARSGADRGQPTDAIGGHLGVGYRDRTEDEGRPVPAVRDVDRCDTHRAGRLAGAMDGGHESFATIPRLTLCPDRR